MKLKTITTFLLMLFASLLFANEVNSFVAVSADGDKTAGDAFSINMATPMPKIYLTNGTMCAVGRETISFIAMCKSRS